MAPKDLKHTATARWKIITLEHYHFPLLGWFVWYFCYIVYWCRYQTIKLSSCFTSQCRSYEHDIQLTFYRALFSLTRVRLACLNASWQTDRLRVETVIQLLFFAQQWSLSWCSFCFSTSHLMWVNVTHLPWVQALTNDSLHHKTLNWENGTQMTHPSADTSYVSIKKNIKKKKHTTSPLVVLWFIMTPEIY